MSTLERLEAHRRKTVRNTQLSLACYAGFLVASVISSLQLRPVMHPVTLLAVGFVLAAFFFLPRDYVPAVLAYKAQEPEEAAVLDFLRRQQRIGLGIRLAYALGAVVTIVLIPRFVAGG